MFSKIYWTRLLVKKYKRSHSLIVGISLKVEIKNNLRNNKMKLLAVSFVVKFGFVEN